MIKIYIDNKPVEVKEGTRVIDLLPSKDKCKYVVCKLGSQIKELNRKLSGKDDGKTVEFLGIDNQEAVKAYEASLRYVVAMAFHNLYPDVRICFGYNASRSIFCQILTKGFNVSKATDEVRDEVDRIIKADMPIERITVSTDEAREIFEKMGRDDKLRILPYRPESLVNIYVCGDYYDYLHAYMVPSTGCIFSYNLMPYSPGIIIQYPRSELNAEIPEFVEESTYGRTLQRATAWANKTKTGTVADINDKVEPSRELDFVQMCEARQNSMLSELGNRIESDKENIRLICIAGPSSSRQDDVLQQSAHRACVKRNKSRHDFHGRLLSRTRKDLQNAGQSGKRG